MAIVVFMAFLPVFGLVMIIGWDLVKQFQEPANNRPALPTAFK